MTLWCTHIFYISLFLKRTCIFTQQAHDVLIMSMQRCINVSLTSSWSHVLAGYLFIFTRHRQRGTIEMTLICLCVHLSILHSIRLSVCTIFFPRLAKCRQIWVFSMPVAFTGKYRHIPENTGKYRKIEFTIPEFKKTTTYTQHLYMFNFNNRG